MARSEKNECKYCGYCDKDIITYKPYGCNKINHKFSGKQPCWIETKCPDFKERYEDRYGKNAKNQGSSGAI